MSHQLDDALNNIWQMRGVTGIALYADGQNLFRHLPAEIDSEQARTFGRHLTQMLATLSAEGRKPQQFYFGYAGGRILIVVHQLAMLVVLLRDDDALAYLAKIATAFVRENYDAILGINTRSPMAGAAAPVAAPSLESWHLYLNGLGRILSKVIGTTQSGYVVSRVLAEQGLSQTKELPQERYMELGLMVVSQVPNKAKQRSLADELKTLVDTFQN